jgi:hypothetical protein
LEILEKLADQLQSKEQVTPTELEEQTMRLLTGVVMLLRQHRANKRPVQILRMDEVDVAVLA